MLSHLRFSITVMTAMRALTSHPLSAPEFHLVKVVIWFASTCLCVTGLVLMTVGKRSCLTSEQNNGNYYKMSVN